MGGKGDPAVDGFLQLIDMLDAEASAVTHAVVRAQVNGPFPSR
jgi:hypothetical protein